MLSLVTRMFSPHLLYSHALKFTSASDVPQVLWPPTVCVLPSSLPLSASVHAPCEVLIHLSALPPGACNPSEGKEWTHRLEAQASFLQLTTHITSSGPFLFCQTHVIPMSQDDCKTWETDSTWKRIKTEALTPTSAIAQGNHQSRGLEPDFLSSSLVSQPPSMQTGLLAVDLPNSRRGPYIHREIPSSWINGPFLPTDIGQEKNVKREHQKYKLNSVYRCGQNKKMKKMGERSFLLINN